METQQEKYIKAKAELQSDLSGIGITIKVGSQVKEEKGINRDILLYLGNKKIACVYIGKEEYKLYVYGYKILSASKLKYDEKTGEPFHRFKSYADCLHEIMFLISKYIEKGMHV